MNIYKYIAPIIFTLTHVETLKPIEFLVSELTALKNSNQLDWRSCSVFFPEGKTCKLGVVTCY